MAAPDGRNRPAGEQESSLAAALAEERKAHGVAKRDLAEALARNAALEGEIAELAEEALTRLEEGEAKRSAAAARLERLMRRRFSLSVVGQRTPSARGSSMRRRTTHTASI